MTTDGAGDGDSLLRDGTEDGTGDGTGDGTRPNRDGAGDGIIFIKDGDGVVRPTS
jgi:hypothetical protein|tara:strand:+ start:320 stop:484 length:165 start_codon:yes stop_codon:yes gene_type:complete